MLEPDHVLVRSVPLTGVSLGRPLGFMFSCAPLPAQNLPVPTWWAGGWGYFL